MTGFISETKSVNVLSPKDKKGKSMIAHFKGRDRASP